MTHISELTKPVMKEIWFWHDCDDFGTVLDCPICKTYYKMNYGPMKTDEIAILLDDLDRARCGTEDDLEQIVDGSSEKDQAVPKERLNQKLDNIVEQGEWHKVFDKGEY